MSRLDDIDPSLAVAPAEISVAATEPRMIAAAARWADGIDFSVGADVERLRSPSAFLARDACVSAGRDPSELAFGCFVQVAVTDGEDEMTEAVRGLIITHARFSGKLHLGGGIRHGKGVGFASTAPLIAPCNGPMRRR